MKFVDYLAKCKRYKELRRQVTKAEDAKEITIQTYSIYGATWKKEKLAATADRIVEQEKIIETLNKELREIFKEK
jgi:hypothetical protein